MRIAVTGTHSSGKTTLAKAISQAYDIPFVRGDKAVEICRSMYHGQPINELTVEQQWTLQQKMSESFDSAFEEKNCVTDGFHLTCIPYGLQFTDGRIRFLPGYESFNARVRKQASQFDYVLYLPPEIGLEDDNFRPKSEQLRQKIDDDLRDLLQEYHPHTTMGTVEQRVATAGAVIGTAHNPLKNYIVLEGLPRSGKSTQLALLQERARREGRKMYVCKRNLSPSMKEFKRLRDHDPYCATEELIELNIASIKHDIEQNNVVERAMSGEIVVADRQKFTVMTMFGSLGVPLSTLYEKLYGMPTAGKTIYLDIPPMLSVQRAMKTQQKSPLKHNLAFQETTRDLYEHLGRLHGFTTINANRPLEEVTEAIWQEVAQ